MENSIYFIVSMTDPEDLDYPKKSSRTWGWYSNLEDAKRVCLGNRGDMGEYLYEYLLIEEVPEGGCGCPAFAKQVQWYKFTYDEKAETSPTVAEIEQPEWAKLSCNFSIG